MGPDLDKVAVMGQSAGNHVVGEGLQANGCSLAKAQVMLDPVDGYDPFGIIKAQNLITPGQKLTYTTPTLLLDNELDPKAKNFLFPACAPANLGAPLWFDAVAGPVFNVNASQYAMSIASMMPSSLPVGLSVQLIWQQTKTDTRIILPRLFIGFCLACLMATLRILTCCKRHPVTNLMSH